MSQLSKAIDTLVKLSTEALEEKLWEERDIHPFVVEKLKRLERAVYDLARCPSSAGVSEVHYYMRDTIEIIAAGPDIDDALRKELLKTQHPEEPQRPSAVMLRKIRAYAKEWAEMDRRPMP